MKLYLYISDPVQFAEGDGHGLAVRGTAPEDFCLANEWPLAGECDIELNLDKQGIIDIAVADIDTQEKEERARHQVKMDMLSEKKQQLLSIEHKP